MFKRLSLRYLRQTFPSPRNIFLDTEAPGMPIRVTEYSLYPSTSLVDLFPLLGGKELAANVMHKALELQHLDKSFDTVIYTESLKMIERKDYSIFHLFNPKLFPKPSRKVSLVKFRILKSLIRIPIYNKISLCPNKILAETGMNEFVKIYKLLGLELGNLDSKEEFLKTQSLAQIIDEHLGLVDSEWIINRVIVRKDSHLIEKLWKIYPNEIEEISGKKKFGKLNFFWLHEWVTTYQGVADIELVSSNDIATSSSLSIGGSSPSSGGSTIPSRISVSYLIQSDSDLHLVKESTLGDTVGLSFVTSSVLSISTVSKSFIIDLESVSLSLYLLRQILADSKTKKIVYSLSSFLDNMMRMDEELVHFVNLVDLRPLGPMGELLKTYLNIDHDRSLAFQPALWQYRPLKVELQEFSANDSFYLVRLNNAMEAHKIAVLSFDPFESR